MTWRIKSDGETPPEVYNGKMYLACASAGFGGALFGYDNAFLGGTLSLDSFRAQFGLLNLPTYALNALESNIIITFQAGCLLACFLALPCAEILGRRPTLIIASIIFIVGAILQLIGQLDAFYAGRFLTGLGVGPLTVVAPLYISEISPPAFRGRCIGLFEISYQIGGLLGFWINYGVSSTMTSNAAQWRIPVAIQLPLIGIFCVGCVFLSETPRFLMKNGRPEAASVVLARLRNLPITHSFLQSEISEIRAEVAQEQSLGISSSEETYFQHIKRLLAECLRPNILYRISVGVVTQLIAQLSGINGINYYSPDIFQSLGVVGNHSDLFTTGIFGVVKFITAVVALFMLVDRLGRKTLLLSGCAIMSVSLYFIAGYLKLASPHDPSSGITSSGTAACAFIYIYVIGYTSSFAGIPFILSSEAVPLNVRAISATLGAAMQWLMNLVITKATPYMITSIGYGTFLFFGSCVVIGAVYVWLFVPETKGVPLEEMASVFGHMDEDIVSSPPVSKEGVEAELEERVEYV